MSNDRLAMDGLVLLYYFVFDGEKSIENSRNERGVQVGVGKGKSKKQRKLQLPSFVSKVYRAVEFSTRKDVVGLRKMCPTIPSRRKQIFKKESKTQTRNEK